MVFYHKGVLRHFLVLLRHLLGLLAGGIVAQTRALPPPQRQGWHHLGRRLAAALFQPLLKPEIANLPFPGQLRRRLELAGPTYVKFGQILAVREDLLPKAITDELKNLFEHLPELPFAQIRIVIESELRRRLEDVFSEVDERPLASASIAQVHRARLNSGDQVVIKVMKPGIRDAMLAELRLLTGLGNLLQRFLPGYQPHYMLEEFSRYTVRELDFTVEADNGAIFAENFNGMPEVVFPKMYRGLSTRAILTMEFLDGFKPGDPRTWALSATQRDRVIDLGAQAILQMLYQDGFFHADLHAGNLLILPGNPIIRIGFIDLGMVGRFEEETRHRMLYYFHALVNRDIEGAVKYLSALGRVDEDSDLPGFRRAVADISRRFLMHSAGGEFSVARLILESIGVGGRYRVFFCVELVLMVKALITFEGVGRMLSPRLDIVALTQRHVDRIFRQQYRLTALAGELLRQTFRTTPEVIDFVTHLPELLSEELHALQEPTPSPRKPVTGVSGSILAGACLMSAVLVLLAGGSPLLWSALLFLAVWLYCFGK
ncbi:MAG: AarF/UbiB family protein [Candidatus Competibacteraceae bacterium]